MSESLVKEIELLVSKMLDHQLTHSERLRMSELIDQSNECRDRYLDLLDNHEALCEIYPGDVFESSSIQNTVGGNVETAQREHSLLGRFWKLVLAASILLIVASAGYFAGLSKDGETTTSATSSPKPDEPQSEQAIAGHAILTRSVDVVWGGNQERYRQGQILPDGLIELASGFVEIDFFSGATLLIEGPASIDIQSDWAVTVTEGRLRASVPPAARGFVVNAAGSQIVDLGTEFSLDVRSDNARVEVIDGEVELRGGDHHGDHLFTGESQWLTEQGATNRAASWAADRAADLEGRSRVITLSDAKRRGEDAQSRRFELWKQSAKTIAQDDRLIAYYPISGSKPSRLVPNLASPGEDLDGRLVGPVEQTTGRFGNLSRGLDFDRVGARVRTRIDGVFKAFTFAAWVKIDSLDHVYNALFMSDGYETGELHWQIREDGKLMFSVMVDDTRSRRSFSERDNRFVEAAGLAKIYFSDPVWDISMSGRWIHVAAVYDPSAGRVRQFVNGETVGDSKIPDTYRIENLRIGPAEIGNWGQPFRDTPWFAVRNLNGTIDELMIFSEALELDEIADLYKQGVPVGY